MSIMHKVVAVAALLSASSANASSLQDRIADSFLGRSAPTSGRQMPAPPPEGRFEDRLAAAIRAPVVVNRPRPTWTLSPTNSVTVEQDIQDRIIASLSGRR